MGHSPKVNKLQLVCFLGFLVFFWSLCSRSKPQGVSPCCPTSKPISPLVLNGWWQRMLSVATTSCPLHVGKARGCLPSSACVFLPRVLGHTLSRQQYRDVNPLPGSSHRRQLICPPPPTDSGLGHVTLGPSAGGESAPGTRWCPAARVMEQRRPAGPQLAAPRIIGSCETWMARW